MHVDQQFSAGMQADTEADLQRHVDSMLGRFHQRWGKHHFCNIPGALHGMRSVASNFYKSFRQAGVPPLLLHVCIVFVHTKYVSPCTHLVTSTMLVLV